MRTTMNAFNGIPSRVYLKDIVFFVLCLFYVLGPLQYVSSFAPTLWSLPAIFVLSAVVWAALEVKLSKQRVEPQNKTIFITGCDSGFGFELAKRMSSKGFHVFAGCLQPDQAAALSKSANISVVLCDVTSNESVLQAAQLVSQQLKLNGKILWGVVANAGIRLLGPVEWCSMSDIETLFDVNVFGVVRTLKAFLPLLRKSHGRFVVTSSTSAVTSYQQLVAYSMSKAAVLNLTDGLRRELGASTGIYFSSILPTFHKTPMVTKNSHQEIEARFKALPEYMQKEISPNFLIKCKREHDAVLSGLAISDLSETLESFDLALSSIRPRPVYICDHRIFLWTLWPIIHHFPVETVDFLFQLYLRLCNYFKFN